MLPFWGRGPNVLYLCPSKAQMNRRCCYISVASIRQWMKLCTRGTSLGIQTTNTPRVNTIVCFDLPDFKGGGGRGILPSQALWQYTPQRKSFRDSEWRKVAWTWTDLSQRLACDTVSRFPQRTRSRSTFSALPVYEGGMMGAFFLLPIRQSTITYHHFSHPDRKTLRDHF